jgi:hypothetical protein
VNIQAYLLFLPDLDMEYAALSQAESLDELTKIVFKIPPSWFQDGCRTLSRSMEVRFGYTGVPSVFYFVDRIRNHGPGTPDGIITRYGQFNSGIRQSPASFCTWIVESRARTSNAYLQWGPTNSWCETLPHNSPQF